MKELRLSKNQFNGNIPTEIGNLSMLTLLSMHANDLLGNIPASIFNISSLEVMMYLFSNNLCGMLLD
ncbi:hypothetical protein SASPL_104249 [Salvia splendens]|uniref:Non-specific serine/threonine protein kinase n=1 Tax=Salvia splendens TaxID=180675 RepID=A0A8X8YLA7_SALSN|nr:hypothetical protein SASPL_104249 [Salvia splendens]